MTTSNVKLLPLPEPHWIGMDTCDAPGPRHYTADQMHAYARANVAHAVAPLQAEIEALRADVRERDASLEWWGRFASGAVNARKDAEARAERLAEALRDAMGYINSMNYPVAIAKIDALLRDQEEGK